jgi:NPH3 family
MIKDKKLLGLYNRYSNSEFTTYQRLVVPRFYFVLFLFQAHPNTIKEERKTLCRLIDARKLTSEASAHAIQNERLPVRSVMQVLFSEHTKLNRLTDWSGSFTGPRSPNPAQFDLSGRCPSKREPLVHQQVNLQSIIQTYD